MNPIRSFSFSGALLAVVLAVAMADAPVAQAVQVDASRTALADAFLPILGASTDGPFSGLPGTRDEADGSTTVLGFLNDLPGPMRRTPVPIREVFAAAGQPAPPVGAGGGVFTREWTEGPRRVVTVGAYVVAPDGAVTNVNVLALEGTADLASAIADAVQRDAVPILLNVLPFALNYAMPTSIVLVLALALSTLAAGAVVQALVLAGFGALVPTVVHAWGIAALAPLFYLNLGYPVHTDPVQGEVYRDFPDTYLWRGLQRTPAGAVWDGAYLSRHGAYAERAVPGPGGEVQLVAEAWKRIVAGPAVRVDARTEKLPGVYERQDLHRVFAAGPGGQRFEAESRLTTGLYHEATGETPGASVRFQERKEGEQVFLYVPHQSDTIALGVQAGDAFVPLLGTRTESWHRNYVDVTNLGHRVGAIEAYRVTSVGAFVGERYVPVFGFDTWNERAPLDLWALAWALGGALGDQNAGDLMARTGTFNHEGRFVAVAGIRVDDDFAGHRHAHRTMVSAGLFVTNPLDPGPGAPGERPDDAVYVPLVGTTYDSPQVVLLWALANAGDAPSGMATWLVSAGTFAGRRDAYLPLVGVEFVPRGYHQDRRAGETYNVGVFPASYATFIPLAALTYDGDRTSAGWAQAFAQAQLGGGNPGAFRTTQGVYLAPAGGYTPVTGLDYTRAGTPTHAEGHRFTAGAYVGGAFQPLVVLTVAFQGPPGTWGAGADTCRVHVQATLVPAAQTVAQTLPCVVGPVLALRP